MYNFEFKDLLNSRIGDFHYFYLISICFNVMKIKYNSKVTIYILKFLSYPSPSLVEGEVSNMFNLHLKRKRGE